MAETDREEIQKKGGARAAPAPPQSPLACLTLPSALLHPHATRRDATPRTPKKHRESEKREVRRGDVNSSSVPIHRCELFVIMYYNSFFFSFSRASLGLHLLLPHSRNSPAMRRYHLIAGLLGCFWWPGTTVTLSGAFCPAAAPAKAVPRQVSARYGRAATSRAGLWLTAVAPQSSQSRPEVAAGGLGEILESRGSAKQRYIFFGGKGGVGKTSTSAASAIRCADSGLTTLIISTDPAHSLGDALDQPVGGGSPVRVEGIDNLWAMEVDAEAAIKDFQDALGAFDAKELASSLGLGQEMVENLGLEEFGELLRNPPPGIDELVALAGVVELAQGGGLPGSGAKGETRYYDRIIIDTAPTGHTLRLLSFPDFLDSFLEKVCARTSITNLQLSWIVARVLK
jgi:hypothetical protein